MSIEWTRADLFTGGTEYRAKVHGLTFIVERSATGWKCSLGGASLRMRWETAEAAMKDAPRIWAKNLRETVKQLEKPQ